MSDSSQIRRLLEQTRHHDKDERFMATSDLTTALGQIEGDLDTSLQTPIRDAILKQLDDTSNDVQAIAVKCLSAIVQKFKVTEVVEIVNKLGQLVISDKKELRDIYAIGLKTIITCVPDDFGLEISKKLITYLLEGLANYTQTTDIDKLTVCLDLLKDLLTRFGSLIHDEHRAILHTITPILDSDKHVLRKRVAVTLGALVHVLADTDFSTLMDGVISKIGKTKKHDDVLYTYIQTIGVFSRHAGVRIGNYLDRIVPVLCHFCDGGKVEGDDSKSEAVIDLRENCLQAFESLIMRCPNDITPHIDKIIPLALNFMSFDPNVEETEEFADADGEDLNWDDDEEGEGEAEWGGDYGGDAYDDEEDELGAWKVRRASIKTLSAFIRAKNEILRDYYEKLCEGLVSRFKDRDLNVKMEVFHAFRDLLSASVVTKSNNGNVEQHARIFSTPQMVRQRSSFDILEIQVPAIVVEVEKQFQKGNVQTKQGVLDVLRELTIVRRGQLEPWLHELIPCLTEAVSEKDTTLRAKGLDLLLLFVNYHSPETIVKYVDQIVPCVVMAMKDVYGRVKAFALQICSSTIQAMRPDYSTYDRKLEPIVRQLYEICFSQMTMLDVEQEVKEIAIRAIAQIIAHFGDLLDDKLYATLPVLMDRLRNEVTRQASLKGLAIIADSPLKVDLAPISAAAVKELCSFLRKHSQALRHETTITLNSLVQNSGEKVDITIFHLLLTEIAPHINDSDLHLSQLVFDLVVSMLQQNPSVKIPRAILSNTFLFVQSPLLQGSALESLMRLFRTFLKNPSNRITYRGLLKDLLNCVKIGLSKQSFSAISQSIASITEEVEAKEQDKTVDKFIKDVLLSRTIETSQIALLCLGEIGRKKNLSNFNQVENVVFNAFTTDSEAVKWAASFALGNLSVGNMPKYLPILLSLIEECPEKQYLLLNSLKEIISVHSSDLSAREVVKPYAQSVIPLLLASSSSKDEGVRTMTAECLGKFAIIDPEEIFPALEADLVNMNPHVRGTMITALKFALSDDTDIALLKSKMAAFLKLMSDTDLAVQRQAFLTLNAVAHANVDLISDLLRASILPTVYKATIIRPELIRTVDLGPFQHKVDDGLPLRKASFLCLDCLVDSAARWINFPDFIAHLRNGITDQDDIQLLTYQIFAKIAQRHGPKLLECLADLPPVLMQGMKKKIKDAKGNEPERAADILRAAVRALDAINCIHGAESIQQFQSFYNRVLKTPQLLQMMNDLQAEKRSR